MRGAWWETLAACGITLLVTREYEHLVVALSTTPTGPTVSYLPMPHPSGLVVDRDKRLVHVVSTRNPNEVYDLGPVTGLLDGMEGGGVIEGWPLVPLRSRFLPGALYLHDLGLIGGSLHANAVGQNAIVALHDNGGHERVWWPRCIELDGKPTFATNHIQLNSIGAGADLAGSYFSASSQEMSSRLPGHRNYPVDGRGVVFSGATREPVITGLTRPHSARLHEQRVWADNSGYGEVGFGEGGSLTPVARLPGWTRGLCFHGRIAFIGTSSVIPRFRRYAPGLDPDKCVCGVHAVDVDSGLVLGSLTWPSGNQVFAIDWMPAAMSSGFPRSAHGRAKIGRERRLFSAFSTASAADSTGGPIDAR